MLRIAHFSEPFQACCQERAEKRISLLPPSVGIADTADIARPSASHPNSRRKKNRKKRLYVPEHFSKYTSDTLRKVQAGCFCQKRGWRPENEMQHRG